MLAYLTHMNCRRIDGVYHLDVRTNEVADMLRMAAKEKGIEVDVCVIGIPHYFKSQQEHFDYLLKNNPTFKEFSDELGLKPL